MRDKRNFKLLIIALAPITAVINYIFSHFPSLVEKYYSTGINKPIIEVLSRVTGFLPFSLAEFLIYFLVLLLVFLSLWTVIGIFHKDFLKRALNLGVYLSILYVMFMFLWGFNYNRQPLSVTLGYTTGSYTKEDLYDLCEELIEKANSLREDLQVGSDDIALASVSYNEAFKRAYLGYREAGLEIESLEGNYGRPKAILISPIMSYTGITGIYIPYTGEANVNYNIPSFMLPCTATHEMAHQRGFAREDEANYLAYLTCTLHPDKDFQYSGTILALLYSMNALYTEDAEAYQELRDNYSEGLQRDMIFNSSFWRSYEGMTEEIANKVNDGYLKSNGQDDGVKSYGRMIDLLIAERSQK